MTPLLPGPTTRDVSETRAIYALLRLAPVAFSGVDKDGCAATMEGGKLEG